MAARINDILNAAVLTWMHDLASQGILLTDLSLNVVGWNLWLEEHSGRRAKEVLGKNLIDLYPDLVVRGLDSHYKDALLGQVRLLSQRLHGYLLEMPAPPDFKEYSRMQQSARISPLSQEGKVIGTVTIIDDVTERVMRESQLQAQLEARSQLLANEKAAREESEAANRLKDEFLATISHELRTPLTAIVGWSTLLRSGRLDADASARAIETIFRNANSQTQLISDLLDVSRIISNKLQLTLSDVDLPSIVDRALDAFKPEAEAKAIQIESTVESNFPVISGDTERLQQIIWNLLSNAVKFTPNGGHIQINLKRVSSLVEISVCDSGIGIDPQFIPFVFDRFRQANSASNRSHGGLGLGLNIVRELVSLHDGTVQVHSEGVGKGATFIVTLPIGLLQNVEPDASQMKFLDTPKFLGGLKGLIVDDEPDTREFVRAVLESCGSEVATASSVAEALDVLEANRLDFLISDLGMPSEDGYALIRRVRELPTERGGDTPAAALTAYARADDRHRALRAGFQVHIAKPIDPETLVSTVARMMHRK
ncbi:MAG TPA: ATP-binding protein [Terriglobia bacterium]|nr:ATP-binding protein [Terriglobia bacterium]